MATEERRVISFYDCAEKCTTFCRKFSRPPVNLNTKKKETANEDSIASQYEKNSLFVEAIEAALNNYTKTTRLGEDSPLASPYFLGYRLDAQANNTQARGRALQRLIDEAIALIEDNKQEKQERFKKIICLLYVQEHTYEVAMERVALSRTPFNRSRGQAIEAVTKQLIKLVNPALRLDSIPEVNKPVERDEIIGNALRLLKERKTISLIGDSGVGKTTVGSCVAHEFPAVFWYTFRLGLNDQLATLLFSVGYFLYQQGVTTLWLEIVAAQGNVNLGKQLSLMNSALEELWQKQKNAKMSSVLFCFDEIEVLNPTQSEEHQRIIEFLAAIHQQAPILLMGQCVGLVVDLALVLKPLSFAATLTLFQGNIYPLDEAVVEEIYQQTAGNPRLLQLCLTNLTIGIPVDQLRHALATSPTIGFLLDRILQKLDPVELTILYELSVFPSAAPADIWQTGNRSEAYHRLQSRHLLQPDQKGGVALHSIYRPLIYQKLDDIQRQQFHRNAATEHRKRGAYTATLYHLIQADEAEQAIWLWNQHKQEELEQGQAPFALSLFRAIPATLLQSKLSKDQVENLCVELERFRGNLSQAWREVHHAIRRTGVAKVISQQMAGEIANDLGEFAEAESAFQEAIHTVDVLVENRLPFIHKGLSWLYMIQQQNERAHRELDRAHYELENMRGNLFEQACDYTQAESHFQAALDLAQKINYEDGIAKTRTNLAALYIRQYHFEQGLEHLTAARDYYARAGKLQPHAGTYISQAALYNLAERYEEAYSSAAEAQRLLAVYTTIPKSLQARIDQAMGEACLGMQQFEEAAHLAQKVNDSGLEDMLPDSFRLYGEVLTHHGLFDLAKSSIEEAIEKAEKLQDLYLAGYAWRALAVMYKKQAQSAAMNEAGPKAIALFQAIKLPNEAHRTLSILGLSESAPANSS